MKRKTKSYLSALRTLLATAAFAGLGLVSARATVFGPLQLPGHGTASGAGVSSVGPIVSGTQTIGLNAGNTVINWAASGGTINTSQPGGFNIGQSATLHFSGGFAPRAVLNVDVSGSPSQIFGTLTGAFNYSIFVANANGITVGPNAVISAPAGLGLIAASVNTAQFLINGNIPVSFASSGPLTVQGNLQGVGGFVLLAGSGAVNVSPTQSVFGTTFATNNVTVIGGVGGTIVPAYNIAPTYTPSDGAGSLTPSATTPTTVTLNLGTSAFAYNMTGLTVLANGNIVNNGVLGGVSNALGTGNGNGGVSTLQWTGTLTNNGTINAELDSYFVGGQVNFQGNTSSYLAYGGLVNNGTIATNSGSTLYVDLPGTIINNAGATISNVGGSVSLYAGDVDLPLFTGVGGAVINHGSIVAYQTVDLEASNSNGTGPNPGGGVFSNGSIQFLSPSAHNNSELFVESYTGNAFLGGTVTTPNDPAGLYQAVFQSGPNPANLFTLGTNVTAYYSYFYGGSLTGPGTLTTANLYLDDFTGNVNNVTSPTNYLANGFHVANGSFGNTNITIDLATTSEGAVGRQVVNLNVAGNATLTSHDTSTFTNSLLGVTLLPTEANAGSNLLVQASGNLTVNPSTTGPLDASLSNAALGVNGFVFPGGIVLIAGNTLTLNTVVDNGYASTVGAGQGIFFQAPTIVTTAPVITSGNAWVNFSTAPTTVPAIYAATPAVNFSPIAYTIVANPSAYHIRPYMP
ncbi:filamentous hemagglutinin N-terminal domain-containing protein [Methylacidimicrobium sp. B4]|uniref:beta strand repeat-containing protein n=1 Tax=Methylacidimicrobium sp. B4 TaxID=2796139 RepID=UPI001A909B26|nr:filamentous hemagglutinin N-terminal domain-containing protein [Methylacidimicrobium sp. B4]QSR84384.1 filamentous hemagglutinin N-terminal domain-containing protein [Methylacidimicrobium sp. B4]